MISCSLMCTYQVSFKSAWSYYGKKNWETIIQTLRIAIKKANPNLRFVAFILQILSVLENIKQHANGLGMWRVWLRRGGCIGSWWGNRREGNHCGDLGVDGWIISGWISRRWDVGIWTGLGWPRIDRWRALVSAVMNLRVPWNAGNFLTSCKPVSLSRRTLHHGVSK